MGVQYTKANIVSSIYINCNFLEVKKSGSRGWQKMSINHRFLCQEKKNAFFLGHYTIDPLRENLRQERFAFGKIIVNFQSKHRPEMDLKFS